MYEQTYAFVGCRIKLTSFILHPTTHLPVFEFLVHTTAGVRVYQPLLNELDSNPNVMLYIWYTYANSHQIVQTYLASCVFDKNTFLQCL